PRQAHRLGFPTATTLFGLRRGRLSDPQGGIIGASRTRPNEVTLHILPRISRTLACWAISFRRGSPKILVFVYSLRLLGHWPKLQLDSSSSSGSAYLQHLLALQYRNSRMAGARARGVSTCMR